MVVKIIQVDVACRGTTLTFNRSIPDVFVHVPGALKLIRQNALFFPYQFNLPRIIEAFEYTTYTTPKTVITMPDCPVVYSLPYERRTYAPSMREGFIKRVITRRTELCTSISHQVTVSA